MTNEPPSAAGGVVAFGFLGALLGAILGAVVWYGGLSQQRSLKQNRDPVAQDMAKPLGPIDTCFALVSAVIGGGLGAAVGATIGAVKASRATPPTHGAKPASATAAPPPEPATEEVVRLQAQIAQMQLRVDELQKQSKPPQES